MPFHNVHEYLALPRAPQAWIVEDVLPTSGYVNIFGGAKDGKSVVAMQLASAVATPHVDAWLGFPVRSHGPVCYLQVDTPRNVWAERMEEVLPYLPLEGVYFADAEEAGLPYPFNILGEGGAWIQGALAAMPEPAVLLVVDTIREIHDQEENSSSEMKRVVSALRAVAREPAILLLSHSRKAQPGVYTSNMMDENRGSGYIAGRMDTVINHTPKMMTLRGRALEETTVGLRWIPEQKLYELADNFHAKAVELVANRKGESLREVARQLQQAYPKKSENACWSMVRRVSKGLEPRHKIHLVQPAS
jgi:RecA-family ATPase